QPRESPTSPGAPAPLVASRLVHAIGVVLKMHAGIAEEYITRRARDQPRHGAVGQRMFAQDGFITLEIGAERAIQTEERARRQAALPECVAVLEAREIKLRAAIRFAERMQRAPVEAGAGRRQAG